MKRNESFSAVPLQPGVFSRYYPLAEGKSVSIAYHTPSQSIAFFEDDSAEVWHRIFQASGVTSEALNFILQNGAFESDPFSEAKATLAGFIDELRASRLIAPEKPATEPSIQNHIESSLKSAVDPIANMELAVSQILADHRTFYSMVLELTYRCNERCVHCYLPEETRLKELSLEQIDALLGEFARMGGFKIIKTNRYTLNAACNCTKQNEGLCGIMCRVR